VNTVNIAVVRAGCVWPRICVCLQLLMLWRRSMPKGLVLAPSSFFKQCLPESGFLT